MGRLWRGYGETTAGPARGTGAVSEGIVGGPMIAIRQPQHKGSSVSHWYPGTSVAEDARRLDWAKSPSARPSPSSRLQKVEGGAAFPPAQLLLCRKEDVKSGNW
jgi:uncharacterized protein YodC (DUF2158 family)